MRRRPKVLQAPKEDKIICIDIDERYGLAYQIEHRMLKQIECRGTIITQTGTYMCLLLPDHPGEHIFFVVEREYDALWVDKTYLPYFARPILSETLIYREDEYGYYSRAR